MSKPSWRERLKPVELLLISVVLGIFAGLVVLMSTRDVMLTLIFFGLAFIVSLVVLAMLALSVEPNLEEQLDLREQDEEEGRRH
jgi:uncharacterized membrane protein HdeD (DUF308 family)